MVFPDVSHGSYVQVRILGQSDWVVNWIFFLPRNTVREQQHPEIYTSGRPRKEVELDDKFVFSKRENVHFCHSIPFRFPVGQMYRFHDGDGVSVTGPLQVHNAW